ncbi:MAG: hypothetical protein MUO39_15420 [Steroidobacteraceae bacterium]|nr:hypothetical protein [Steroidobacteraceae bacterium]
MNKVTVLAGITVLAIMAGCAKKEAPQAQAQAQAQAQDDDEDVGATATLVQPAAAQPEPKDRSEAAAGMIASIDPGPQCQVFRDELEAKGATPGPVKELSAIFVQAYEAGCGRKKQQ